MANYTIGDGGDFTTLELAATDPTANTAGNVWTILNNLFPVANVAAIDTGVIIKSGGFLVDTSSIASGTCITGGSWENPTFIRVANTAATVVSGGILNNSTVYTPIQAAPLVGCTGDRNAVTTLDGVASGITGTDNKWVVNATGVTGAYTADDPALYCDGINDWAVGVNFISAATFEYQLSVKFMESALSGLHVYCGCQNGSGSYPRAYLSISDGFLSYGIGSKSAGANVTSFTPDKNTEYGIQSTHDGATFRLYVDNIEISSIVEPVDTLTSPIGMGAYGIDRTPNSYYSNCIVSKFEVCENGSTLAQYFQNGDFGSATLTDHSGNGNDGTINGATWVLTTNYTPLIDGTLKLADGSYAGAVQPVSVFCVPTLNIGIGIGF
ncbi:MAG: hypothetical protein GY941_22065 [Planctomycetes bacterium]|nr:hypothetical protein [Planctomycetota bacterium]